MGVARVSVGGLLTAAPVRGSPAHGPTASGSEPVGVPRLEVGNIAMSWPHLRTAQSALPLADTL